MANRHHTAKELAALRARQHAEREARTDYQNDNQVLTFRQWCALNNFGSTTGKRVIAAGGVDVVQLSAKRIGITVGANRQYQARRTRKAG